MRFVEAEQTYRELEAKLVRGEIVDNEFLAQVALLRLTDNEGRRWMISGRTGRWLVHDGQQWVFAEPPQEEAGAQAITEVAQPLEAEVETRVTRPPEKVEPRVTQPPEAESETQVREPVEAADAPATVVAPVTAMEPQLREPPKPRAGVPSYWIMGIAVLLMIGCLIAGGISAWVLFLRNLGEPTPVSTVLGPEVGLVETFTPRPATPTYTPTSTPTPSRTPTPTITPTATETPIITSTSAAASPTPSSEPLATVESSASPAASPSAVPTYQTYVVQAGETLSEIAARFGVTVQALSDANGITNPALVRAGQVLVIPAPGTTPMAPTATPTWTPIVLSPQTATPTSTSTATSTATPTNTPAPTPTRSGPTSTPRPTATPTPKPPPLSGKIAFTVWNPSFVKYELYVSLIDGSGRNMIGQGFRQPQFDPDGNWLAVNGDGASNLEHLVRIDASGGGAVEISNHAEDSYPSWHSQGKSVAYSSSSWGDGRVRLGIVQDVTYKDSADWLPFGSTEIEGEYPFWMASGWIVYHGCEFWGSGANCGLYKARESGDTDAPQRLTTHQSDTAPAGFGQRVAFMSSRDGNWEVYVIGLDGSGLQRLTSNNAADGLPTWSPDGKSIAFVSNRSGAWAIWAMDASGTNQRKLFDLGGGYGNGEYEWTTERISWAP